MTTFETGKTYFTRSVCDHNCIFELTVAKRTAKTITTTEGKRLGIRVWDDVETVMPEGRYSMAPCISADREVITGRFSKYSFNTKAQSFTSG